MPTEIRWFRWGNILISNLQSQTKWLKSFILPYPEYTLMLLNFTQLIYVLYQDEDTWVRISLLSTWNFSEWENKSIVEYNQIITASPLTENSIIKINSKIKLSGVFIIWNFSSKSFAESRYFDYMMVLTLCLSLRSRLLWGIR